LREICARSFPQVFAEKNPKAALAQARKMAGGEAIVVVTGSLYLVGETMELLGIKP
jgi:folylpolyglutamate synthase/dihydropteroate synthase